MAFINHPSIAIEKNFPSLQEGKVPIYLSTRRLAVALQVSTDVLIFGADERGPDGELQLQFEAVSRFSAEEKKVIKALLEGMILKHEAKRWSSAA